jgi:hypothetical protein
VLKHHDDGDANSETRRQALHCGASVASYCPWRGVAKRRHRALPKTRQMEDHGRPLRSIRIFRTSGAFLRPSSANHAREHWVRQAGYERRRVDYRRRMIDHGPSPVRTEYTCRACLGCVLVAAGFTPCRSRHMTAVISSGATKSGTPQGRGTRTIPDRYANQDARVR